ncbi:MAG: pseudouridine synthase [Patescibacteria group bacterium]
MNNKQSRGSGKKSYGHQSLRANARRIPQITKANATSMERNNRTKPSSSRDGYNRTKSSSGPRGYNRASPESRPGIFNPAKPEGGIGSARSKPKSNRKRKAALPVVNNDTYPMRVNKYLAHRGIATRTGADELIKSSKVLINGILAKLGDKVTEKDKVEVRGVHQKKNYIYLAYNKPRGIVSTNPQRDEKGILENIKTKTKVFPVGRLDKDSHGLIILTNDGRITDRLLNPANEHEKEYIVEVDRKFTPAFQKHMEEGVDIGDPEPTKPAQFKKLKEDRFKIILKEGRNRQIRRMTEKLGYTVRDLQRVRVQNIELGKIPQNSYVEITGEDRTQFLKSLNLE